MPETPVKAESARRVGRMLGSALILGAVLTGLILLALFVVHRKVQRPPSADIPPVALVPGTTDMLDVTPEVRAALGLLTTPVKTAVKRERLELLGSLFIDPNEMAPVRARFPGEVVAIGPVRDGAAAGTERPLRVGDMVTKGQLLAVVWSKDLGETKSDLVDAYSQLAQHERQYKKLQSLEKGLVSEKDVREAQRLREADVIKIETLERTLRSWKLLPEEIDVARLEAEKIHKREGPTDIKAEQHWAEVEVRAPQNGVLLERNVTLGDLVTTDLDLFKVADLSRLGVMVQAYEENLAQLAALPPQDRVWTVHLKSQAGDRGTNGSFETIGKVIDPAQQTATVTGWVDNRAGRLRVGQFVVANIDLPAAAGEVIVPKSALVEQGSKAVVFVASDREAKRVEMRVVSVAHRSHDHIYVHSAPSSAARTAGCKPLKAGDLVISSGAVELTGALADVLASRSVDEPAGD